jgi:hypothetical protein
MIEARMRRIALAAVPLVVLVAAADPAPPAQPLARSSIAAVVARSGELGLGPAQVKDLKSRDEALQREQAAIRERLAPPPEDNARSPLSLKVPGGGAGPPGGTTGGPRGGGAGPPGGTTGGPRGGGGGGGGDGRGPPGPRGSREDASARREELVRALDDADTRAWLEAEARLPAELREKATAVAARHREELADQRERGR